MAPQREWFDKDYYRVLGVSETASAKEITKAYRKLARQFHPDANHGDPKSEERFKEISSAYDVVGDEAKRKEYDETRRSAHSDPAGTTKVISASTRAVKAVSAICSATCSDAGAQTRRAPVRSGAPTSKPS